MSLTPEQEATHGPKLSVTRARQGLMDRDVFWVLLFSTVLATAALGGSWLFSANDTPSLNAVTPAVDQFQPTSVDQTSNPAAPR